MTRSLPPDVARAAAERLPIKRLLTRAVGYPLAWFAALAGVLLVIVSRVIDAPDGHAPRLSEGVLIVVAVVLAVAAVGLVFWSRREIARIAEAHDRALHAAEGERAMAGDSESRLAGIIDSAMDAIIIVDAAWRIVVYNAMAERVFGWRAHEMIAQPLDRLLPERFRAQHDVRMGRFAKTGETARSMGAPGQLIGLRRSGDEFPVEATISQVVVRGEQFLTVILRDIGPRMAAERALRESEERFRLFAEGAEDYALYFLAADGAVMIWNGGAERLTGYTAREVVGSSVDRFLTDADRGAGRLQKDLREAAERGSVSVDGIEVGRGGRQFLAGVTLTALRGADGVVTGYARLVRDISRERPRRDEPERAG